MPHREKNLISPKTETMALTWNLILRFTLLLLLSSCGGGNSNSNSESVNFKVWHHPLSVASSLSEAASDATSPQAAMDNDGNVIVVWSQAGLNGENNIYLSEYRNGVWKHPQSLDDYINLPMGGGYFPQVAMANSGNAIVVWNQNNGPTYMSEYRNGAWNHPASLSDTISPTGPYGDVTFEPKVAMNASGTALIVWKQRDGFNGEKLYLSEYRNGQWHHPAALSENISPTPQAGSHLYAQDVYDYWVEIDDSGMAIIVWRQVAGNNIKLFKSEYRNGTWLHPIDNNDFISINGTSVGSAHVAMANNGEAVIVWEQPEENNGLIKIYVSEYRQQNWIYPTAPTDNLGSSEDQSVNPLVAMADNGNTRILYARAWSNTLHMSEYVDGFWTHNESPATEVNPLPSEGLDASISSDSKGNTLVAWRSSQDPNNFLDLYLSEYVNGGWKTPSSLDDYINVGHGVASTPQIAMNENGQAIVTWQQYTENGVQIFISHRK